jgi:subtilisin family serine protease
MTLRTAALIARHAENLRQASPRALPTANGAEADSSAESTVGVMLSLADTFSVGRIAALGVSVGVCAGGVATARATPAQLAQLAQLSGVLFISADSRVRKKLDVAAPLTGADVVQQGGGSLAQAYTGRGVVIGIVDWGFDFTHATFRDTLNNLRIARVWDQTGDRCADCNDSLTYGFTYGAMYATESDMLRQKCSSSSESHGTHVAGIAAGSGMTGNPNGKIYYKGIAPEAELVLVQLNDGAESELVDGMSYVFKYAEQVGKPAVVNFSLGSHYGPHDGTSPFDRALEQLTGAGRIAVGAAGNEGNSKMHASYTFGKSGGIVRTVIGVTKGAEAKKKSEMIAFAPAGLHLNWTIELWDAATHTRLEQASGNNFYSTQTGGSLTNKRFTASGADVTVTGHGYNGYSKTQRGVVEVEVTNTNSGKYAVVLALKMTQDKLGTVHLWNLGNEEEDEGSASFGALKTSSETWIDGDNSYTVGEIGGVSRHIISVGSYNSRRSGGETVGAVSSFSSKGPTTDGRVKPDLIAPGNSVVSSINRCAFPFDSPNTYSAMSGTSMATPIVTGAVALMLQKNPKLIPDSVRCILQQNATMDAPIENLPQNTRGAGKLNILHAMEQGLSSPCMLLSVEQSRRSDSRQAVAFQIIPNPNSGVFSIETEEAAANLTVSVYSMVGTLLYAGPVQVGKSVNLCSLPHGIYVVQLRNGKKAGANKMLIYR